MKIKILLCLFLASSAAVSAQFLKIDYETNSYPEKPCELYSNAKLIDEHTVISDVGYNNESIILFTYDFKTGKTNKLIDNYYDKSGKKEKLVKSKSLRIRSKYIGMGDDGEHLIWLSFVDYNSKFFLGLRLYSYRENQFKLIKELNNISIKDVDYEEVYSPCNKFIGFSNYNSERCNIHILNLETFEYKLFSIPIEDGKDNDVRLVDFVVTDEGEVVALVRNYLYKNGAALFYCIRVNPFENGDVDIKILDYKDANSIYKQSVNFGNNGEIYITSVTRNTISKEFRAQIFLEGNANEKTMEPVSIVLEDFGENEYAFEFTLTESIPLGSDKSIQVINYISYKGMDAVQWSKVILINEADEVISLLETRKPFSGERAALFLHYYNEYLYIFGSFLEKDEAKTRKEFESIPVSSYKLKCYRFDTSGKFDLYTFDKPGEALLMKNSFATGNRVGLRVYDKSGGFKGDGPSTKEGYIFLNLE